MQERQTTRELLGSLRENFPDVASRESDVVLALIRLNALARRGVEALLGDHALTPAAFEVLVTLRSAPPPRRLTPTELYRANLLSSGGLTKILNSLSGHGLIELASNADDGRSKTVALTAKGKRLVEKIARSVSSRDKALFADRLSPARIARLRTELLDVLAALEGE